MFLLADEKGDDRGGGKTGLDPLSLGDLTILVLVELGHEALDEAVHLGGVAAEGDADALHLVHEAGDLLAGEGAAAVGIEGAEEELELLLVGAGGQEGEGGGELLEAHGAAVVSVHEVEQVLHLLGGGALHVGGEEGTELVEVELAALVLVECPELLLQLVQLSPAEACVLLALALLLSHGCCRLVKTQ